MKNIGYTLEGWGGLWCCEEWEEITDSQFSRYLFYTYYVPDPVLGPRNSRASSLALKSLTIQCWWRWWQWQWWPVKSLGLKRQNELVPSWALALVSSPHHAAPTARPVSPQSTPLAGTFWLPHIEHAEGHCFLEAWTARIGSSSGPRGRRQGVWLKTEGRSWSLVDSQPEISWEFPNGILIFSSLYLCETEFLKEWPWF